MKKESETDFVTFTIAVIALIIATGFFVVFFI